jgi:hypothetical protein
MPGYPVLLHTAIDARDCRGLAEFHRDLLGPHYRPGDEIPATRRCFTTDLRMRENLYVMADPAGHPFCLLVQ